MIYVTDSRYKIILNMQEKDVRTKGMWLACLVNIMQFKLTWLTYLI